jgi:hypothetical protein
VDGHDFAHIHLVHELWLKPLQGVLLDLGAHLDEDARERLAHLDLRLAPRGASQRRKALDKTHFVAQDVVDARPVCLRPVAQVHGRRRVAIEGADEVLVQLLGDEGRDRRDEL